jgi:hypothetical protein
VPAVVHIGLFKTATTTLQRQFFPALSGCVFLTRGHGEDKFLFRLLATNLCNADDDSYMEATFRSFLQDKMRNRPETLVMSHEAFSGAVYDGMYNAERNADRLRALLPDGRIVVVVRNQGAMLRSLYNFHVQKGGFASFEEFVANRADGCDFDPDHLHYDTLIARFQQRFGSESVKVLLYESLVARPGEFLAELSSFITGNEVRAMAPTNLGTDNRSLSPPSRWLLRHANQLFRVSRFNPKPRLTPIARADKLRALLQNVVDPRLLRGVTQRSGSDEAALANIVGRYEQSNSRVEEMTGLSLRQWGYRLPGGASERLLMPPPG